ncbi:MAG: IS4 family transposase, partial [Cyclobacteriaceae bacterium]|nr:IS4 family transposase [Cyclobacteriaceae bacterium]
MDFLASGLANFFNEQAIENLARATNFVKRKSKLTALRFLNSLMFAYHHGKDLSLLDICGDFFKRYHIIIKKQSIHERFNEKAVAFMKGVLNRVLEGQFKVVVKENLSVFNRIRIKDSTRFALPPAYAKIYQGHGGATHNSQSMISIQYEYDLVSGNAMDLRLTNGRRNDQLDAKENTHDIVKNDLFIRDLGYATLGYLSQIIENLAYFLNRLNTQTAVYFADNPKEKVDFIKCYKQLKKQKLPFLEYKVVVGKKEQIPCRLII